MAHVATDFQTFLDQSTCIKPDVVDNPTKVKHEESVDPSQKKIFATMKYEINRLNSYKNKWPLSFIKPEDLAEAGFFYLQTEDKVQCAFCGVTIYNWTLNDRPLRNHMKNSPKCPLLNSRDVGNVPIFRQNLVFSQQKSHGTSYKPKHPTMADAKRRLMSYKGWPLLILNPTHLSKCGLFYTGVADVVTCFFCGGSLGNWEPNDDPLVEHEKFYPDCAFLILTKNNLSTSKPEFSKMGAHSSSLHHLKSVNNNVGNVIEQTRSPRRGLSSEIIEQACEIFPQSLVLDVVGEHIKRTGENVTSLHDLCEEILEYKAKKEKLKSEDCVKVVEKRTPEVKLSDETAAATGTIVESCGTEARNKRDNLLCKICMDQEMGVVFLPCGHLVSCLKCSREISNCPLCRRPITNTVRTYLS